MKTTTLRSSIATALAVAGLALCTAAQASTFSITSSTSGTNTTFTIRRSGEGTNSAERVCYRAVSRSALAGLHFVDKFGNGTLVFSAGETSRQIQITEKTAAQINDARFTYYQSGGVYAYSTFTVSGSPVICGNKESVGTANNVYLRSGCTITVDGLSKGAFIGVDTANVPHGDVTITIATGASAGDAAYFFNDDYRYHVEQDGSTVVLVAGSPAVFKDHQGQEIAEPAVVSWLLANRFSQGDIYALGFDGGQIEKESISFGAEDDPCFDTEKTTCSVTQSVTATFDVSHVTDKFFKAVIQDDSLDDPDPFPEEPNPDDPDPNAPEE